MSRPLPWPASALRDRLRALAATVGDTREQVVAGREEAQRRFDAVEAAIAALPAPPAPPPPLDEARLLEAIRVAAELAVGRPLATGAPS